VRALLNVRWTSHSKVAAYFADATHRRVLRSAFDALPLAVHGNDDAAAGSFGNLFWAHIECMRYVSELLQEKGITTEGATSIVRCMLKTLEDHMDIRPTNSGGEGYGFRRLNDLARVVNGVPELVSMYGMGIANGVRGPYVPGHRIETMLAEYVTDDLWSVLSEDDIQALVLK
jgi:hypothetical protein